MECPLHPGITTASQISAISQKTSLQCASTAVRTSILLRTPHLRLDRRRSNRRIRNKGSVLAVRASANGEMTPPIAPFQPESPTGQYLAQLLQSHPHLVPAAVDHELEKLAEKWDSEDGGTQPSSTGSELVLYRRIAEVKQQERQRALEEIIYTLIVQKFVESGIAMVPSLMSITAIEKPWPVQELESVHSIEVLEMIRQHLALVLGSSGSSDYLDQNTYAQLSKARVGQVYAASIIYGYFLRRIFQRFQLEKSMKMLPPGVGGASAAQAVNVGKEADTTQKQLVAEAMAALGGFEAAAPGPVFLNGAKPTVLQSYIMSMDLEMLQKIANIRSRESLRVLEKHTEALFGRPEVAIAADGSMKIQKDEVLKISFAGLKHLVLEAVAFGSFLWDVESYVDASYAFV